MKKLHRRFANNSGSMTVEASLVFPVIFLAIVTIIYICILLYQQAYLKSLANHAAERGAACWSNISKMEISSDNYRIETGRLEDSEELLNTSLYWRITKAYEEEKIKNLKTYIIHKLKKNNILESQISKESTDRDGINDRIDIWLKDYIVYKELNVKIKDSYRIPLGNILRVFGLDGKYNIEIHSRAVIDDPIEFIRSTDFIVDTLKEYEGTGELMDKFKEAVDRVKENIEKFFEDIGGKDN